MIILFYYLLAYMLNVNHVMRFPKLYMKTSKNYLNKIENIEKENTEKENFFSKINLSLNSYTKTITYSKFLKKEIFSQIFDYNFNMNPRYLYTNLTSSDIINLINKKIKPKNLKNELLFLLNNKVKIYIHIEQLFYKTNIYHIGVTFRSIKRKVRYDITGYNINNVNNVYNNKLYNLYSKTMFWDYTNKSIKEIIEYEKKLDYKYILGIYDCRHYVKNLTTWSCNNPTPVWKLSKLIT